MIPILKWKRFCGLDRYESLYEKNGMQIITSFTTNKTFYYILDSNGDNLKIGERRYVFINSSEHFYETTFTLNAKSITTRQETHTNMDVEGYMFDELEKYIKNINNTCRSFDIINNELK